MRPYLILQMIFIAAWYAVPQFADAPLWLVFLPTITPLALFLTVLTALIIIK